MRGLFVVDQQAGTVTYFHASMAEYVLTQRVFLRPFRLAELRFGAEEAERDDLLDASFVGRHSLDRILSQGRSIVIGDRGSGKSAIFRKLAEENSVETLPVANTGDLLHRIVDKDAWLDADALRAAWLVVVAVVMASTISGKAPKALRNNAANLRAALGLSTAAPGRLRRAMSSVARLIGGTTLKFGVGPVNFEAKLPAGIRPSGSFLDAETLLQETDQHHMVGSMGRVGAAGDNAAMESFFGLLQNNVLDRRTWPTRQQLRNAIVTWIERTYHRRRRQRSLNRLTPIEYEIIMTSPASQAA
jgi:hypothetical protein